MSKIWFFGDSFCAYNENWVSDLAQKCNCEVAHLGLAGSSLTFLLNDLSKYRDTIQPQDRVVILFTGIYRDYFNGYHFLTTQHSETMSNSSRPGTLSNSQTKELLETFEKFRFLFFNKKEYKVRATATVSHIINSIIPVLKTERVVYHYTLNNKELLQEVSLYVKTREYEPLDFISFGHKFCKEYIPNADAQEILLSQDRIYGDVNHWVIHPKYKEKWWETYEPLFRDLY